MKIPLYRPQATPTSEAPGRSFRARMQSQPYVQAEIEKGNVLGEALNQAAGYADMRYKMAREAQLNDALLAADEQLREETETLSKSKQLYNVLDGDNPVWNKNVDGIRKSLRATLGKDREALRAFDEKFKQAEMSQRFKLRGVLDAKIQKQIALQRKQKLEKAEDASVEALSISEIFLNLEDAKVDGMRARDVLKANPDALEGQQGALIINIAKRRIQKVLDNAENPIAVISALRKAAFEGDQSGVAALGVGVVEAELLELIPASDRAAILRSGETLASYIDGPTLEEKAILERKGSELSVLSSDMSDVASMIEKNIDVSDEQIAELESRLNTLSIALPGDVVTPVREQINSIKDYRAFRNDMVALKTPAAMGEFLTAMEAKEQKTPDDVAKIEFARKVYASTLRDIEEDVVAWAEKTNPQSGIVPMDLSFSNPDQSAAELKQRASAAVALHNVSGRRDAGRPIQMFSKYEQEAFISAFEGAPLSQKMTTLMSMEQAFRDTDYEDMLYDLYAKIGEKNPLIAHAGGLISMGRNEAAREIFQGLEQIDAGVQIPKKTSAGTSTSAVISTYLQEALRFQPEATGAIIKATEAIIANRFIGLSEADLTEELVIEAMQTAAGRYQKGGVTLGGLQLVNNAQTFMPKDASVDRFEQVMDNLTPEMMAMMGYEVDPKLWSQVADGDWTFQVAGEGQYRIMKDVEPSSGGVPTFLNGFNLSRGGEAEPVLIDFYAAEQLLIQTKQSQTVSAISELGATVAEGMPFVSVPVASPDMPAVAQDVAPDLMKNFDETQGILSAQMATALKNARTAEKKADVIAELVPPNRFKTLVKPLLDSVPKEVSDDEYVEYVDAVLNGFGKPYNEWKASQ